MKVPERKRWVKSEKEGEEGRGGQPRAQRESVLKELKWGAGGVQRPGSLEDAEGRRG